MKLTKTLKQIIIFSTKIDYTAQCPTMTMISKLESIKCLKINDINFEILDNE